MRGDFLEGFGCLNDIQTPCWLRLRYQVPVLIHIIPYHQPKFMIHLSFDMINFPIRYVHSFFDMIIFPIRYVHSFLDMIIFPIRYVHSFLDMIIFPIQYRYLVLYQVSAPIPLVSIIPYHLPLRRGSFCTPLRDRTPQ